MSSPLPATLKQSPLPQKPRPAIEPKIIQIAHLIPYLGTSMGGPVASMAEITSLLTKASHKVSIFTTPRDSDGPAVQLEPQVLQFRESNPGWGSFRRCPTLWNKALVAPIDLVHSHGLWTDTHRLAAHISSKRKIPHLLAPCGMLSPGALSRHRWKKIPVQLWFQNRALHQADCLHAKSEKEMADLRNFGLRNPIAVIPNPITAQTSAHETATDSFREKFHVPREKKIVLFLGRIHPVKGLPRLLNAWASIPEHHRAWVLVLAGPDEGGHRTECESLIQKLGCSNTVFFTGELSHAWKWNALRNSNLFVLPSDFENFGNVIVEAMLCALPVITTTGTPWTMLDQAGAGRCVAPAVEPLAQALKQMLHVSDDEHATMGRSALQLAQNYRPEKILEDLLAVYQWLLRSGPRPSCVHLATVS